MIWLSSCEEIIYEETIKMDTVWLERNDSITPRPVGAVIILKDTIFIYRTDTVNVEVVIIEHDTLIQIVTRDSIIIKEVEKIVTILDTVILNQIDTIFVTDTLVVTQYDRTVIYKDTFYLSDSSHPYSWVPNEVVPFVTEFVNMAYDRGKTINGQPLVIQYVHADDLPGENWSSFSYHFGNQYVIELSEELPTEQHRAGVFREMARLELVPRKKYSSDVNKVMCPLWSPSRVITTQDLNELYK